MIPTLPKGVCFWLQGNVALFNPVVMVQYVCALRVGGGHWGTVLLPPEGITKPVSFGCFPLHSMVRETVVWQGAFVFKPFIWTCNGEASVPSTQITVNT